MGRLKQQKPASPPGFPGMSGSSGRRGLPRDARPVRADKLGIGGIAQIEAEGDHFNSSRGFNHDAAASFLRRVRAACPLRSVTTTEPPR